MLQTVMWEKSKVMMDLKSFFIHDADGCLGAGDHCFCVCKCAVVHVVAFYRVYSDCVLPLRLLISF